MTSIGPKNLTEPQAVNASAGQEALDKLVNNSLVSFVFTTLRREEARRRAERG